MKIVLRQRPSNERSSAGYSLAEVLLVLAIISLVVGFSVPIFQSFQNRNDLDLAIQKLALSLRKAQFFSQGVREDADWGMRINNHQFVVFEGDTFSTRDTDFDEALDFSSNISNSGLQEVIFEKRTGEAQSTGNINLTSIDGEVRTLSIDEFGFVEY